MKALGALCSRGSPHADNDARSSMGLRRLGQGSPECGYSGIADAQSPVKGFVRAKIF